MMPCQPVSEHAICVCIIMQSCLVGLVLSMQSVLNIMQSCPFRLAPEIPNKQTTREIQR